MVVTLAGILVCVCVCVCGCEDMRVCVSLPSLLLDLARCLPREGGVSRSAISLSSPLVTLPLSDVCVCVCVGVCMCVHECASV